MVFLDRAPSAEARRPKVRLLALDPGSQWCGLATFDIDLAGETFSLASARAQPMAGLARPIEDACWLRRELDDIDHVVIERPGPHPFKSGAASARLHEVIGLFVGIAAAAGYPVRMLDDGTVKEALAGRAIAHKYEVHWALVQFGYALPQRERPRQRETSRQRCPSCAAPFGSTIDPRHSSDAADAIAVGHVACARLLMEAREI